MVAVFPRSFLALLIVAAPVGMGVLFGACSSLQGAPAGTQCFSAIDCAAGLVCIKKGSTSVCSSNLTSIETMIDSGMDAASGDVGPIMLADGALQPGTDAGSPGADTGMPPVDAAQPVDTGQPPVDTGAPHDTGVDTGHDAGTPPVDAAGAS